MGATCSQLVPSTLPSRSLLAGGALIQGEAEGAGIAGAADVVKAPCSGIALGIRGWDVGGWTNWRGCCLPVPYVSPVCTGTPLSGPLQ